ncbi:MAG: GIY-YIG nuclease family protein, partial [Tannerella sp.]|nr:GIY-YIG nuclease family protein [Tannerella sp.]
MDDDKLAYFISILSTIPEKPGCYQYFDEKGVVIYVGKAKNLRRRVSTYFQQEPMQQSHKTRVLVKRICEIKY